MILEFDRLPLPKFDRWLMDSSERPAPHWSKVTTEAEGVRSVKLLIEPYRPYLPTDEGFELSAFYVASNHLNSVAGTSSLKLPLKPLIAGYGIGAYGRAGVVAIPGIGTRFAAAAVASDEEPDEKWIFDENRPLSTECADCAECVAMCPNGAISGTGRVDIDTCLRAQAQYQTPRMPDSSREMIGRSLWGCEICQMVCPRNAGITPVAMPDELSAALNIGKLLDGDVAELGKWIGTNYARQARMQARACLVAANAGRTDMVGKIKKLLESPVEAVRDCAVWALNKIDVEGK